MRASKYCSGPVPSTEPGFVQIPFWPALNYLEIVARRAGELGDRALAEKIIGVVRDVTNFRDSKGDARDNYNTYFKFAEIVHNALYWTRSRHEQVGYGH